MTQRIVRDNRDKLVSVNDYVVKRKLGEGGFGVTYLALLGKKEYALKEMESKDATEEFKAMKKLVNDCDHHVLCPVELIRARNTSYLISDFIKGTSLERYLSRADNRQVTRGFVEKMLMQILDALKTIHHLKMAHRDLKPENIMFSRRGHAYHFTLIDFGLAASKASRSLAGTALYTAPAIYELRKARKTIPLSEMYSSDIFALGVTMFELLEVGKYPYNVESGISRTTPASDQIGLAPYDINRTQHYINNERATRWMKNLFEVMTYMSVWNKYETIFTAEALHAILVDHDYKLLADSVKYFEVFL
jgi:serine/threonine protein kinase